MGEVVRAVSEATHNEADSGDGCRSEPDDVRRYFNSQNLAASSLPVVWEPWASVFLPLSAPLSVVRPYGLCLYG